MDNYNLFPYNKYQKSISGMSVKYFKTKMSFSIKCCDYV